MDQTTGFDPASQRRSPPDSVASVEPGERMVERSRCSLGARHPRAPPLRAASPRDLLPRAQARDLRDQPVRRVGARVRGALRAPGDPAQAMLGTQATPEALHQLRHQLGLDRPLYVQYLDWARGFVHGDFGVSATTEQPIAPLIRSELEVTLPLVLLSLLLALVVAVPTGIVAALRQRRFSGTSISAASQIGIAIPEFWAGILLITIISVDLGWLPAGSFPGWSESVGGLARAPDPAGDRARARAGRGADPLRPLGRARGAARGLHAHRARRRDDARRRAPATRAAQRGDADRDADRPAVRRAARRRRRDRAGLHAAGARARRCCAASTTATRCSSRTS